MRVYTLAAELGVEDKAIRQFLRSRYGTQGRGARWELDEAQVREVRFRFEEGIGHRVTRRGSDSDLSIPPLARKHGDSNLPALVRALRQDPQKYTTSIPVVGGEPMVFRRIMSTYGGRYTRRGQGGTIAFLSDGTFLDARDATSPDAHLLERNYTVTPSPPEGSTRLVIHHINYVEALKVVPNIPHRLRTLLYDKDTGPGDTPQERLISTYSVAIINPLSSLINVLSYESSGANIYSIPLRSLLRWELPGGYHRGDELTSAVARYLTTINLFLEDPTQPGSAFDITLGEVYKRFHYDVGEKANRLQEETAERLGFKLNKGYGSRNGQWEKRKGDDQVTISQDLKIHINRKFVCIVSARTSDLPYGDEVARRMLTVATAHRMDINTIRPEERIALARLFSEEKE